MRSVTAGEIAIPERAVTAQGQAPTVSELYEQYFEFVWRVLRGCGVSESAIEDAVQDVFLVVHRRLTDFVPNASYKTWLFGVSVRVASEHRRRNTRKGGGLELREELVAAQRGDPHGAAVRNEALELVASYVDTLDEGKRQVFVLAELQQMTAPEIAELLNIKLNTVYSRLAAARRGFVARVEERYGIEMEGQK